jgi:hypothetical protein
MNSNIRKLKLKGLSQRVAGKIVHGGFHTPKAIKAASDEQLLVIPGINVEDIADIRLKIG